MFSLMRDFNDDTFFSGPMESMRRMESMMMQPFGGLFGGQRALQGVNRNDRNMLMPFGFGNSLFPNMDDMFANFEQMRSNPECHSFSSSSVISYTTDETGRPQMYQASQSTRMAPGGIKETRRSVQDTRTGLQEMAIGHHMHERGHVVEKKKNRFTGDEEENHEYINIDEEEADQFNQEWQHKAQGYNGRPMRAMIGSYDSPRRARSPRPDILAITDGSSPEHGKKKLGKNKRKHGASKSSHSHVRPSPYE